MHDRIKSIIKADCEDVGGNGMTPEQVEHIAVTMFGCPPSDQEQENDEV